MKTKEAERQTGLSKQTLIWYEKEGLIHPQRTENGYRDYSEQDIKLLRLVKMLRSMDISIDDIRKILKDHLSMEDVFRQQKEYLRQEEKRIQDTGEKIRFYADANVPMIEDLHEIYKPREDRPIGPFHIGTRPSRKLLARILFLNALWLSVIAFAGIAFICNFENMQGIPLPALVLAEVLGAMALSFAFGPGIPWLGIANSIRRCTRYVEFSREGITYIRADTMAEKIRFLRQSFKNQETMTFVPYEQIERAEIIRTTKYVRAFTPFAHELFVTSFIFHFKDQSSYAIFNQFRRKNDEEVIIRILKEYIGQVECQQAT